MSLPALRSLTLHELATYAVPGLLKIRVEGHAPLPREGPVLLLVNHCSVLDPWLLSLAAGRPVQVGASSPLFWLPGLGDLASRLNTVPLLPADGTLVDAPKAFAKALERGLTVAAFADHALEQRPEGPRYTVAPGFLEILLATQSERIAVVPMLAAGRGWRFQLKDNPLLATALRIGARVFDAPYPPVLYAENSLRVGRPVYWRDGDSGTTLQDFRQAVEDSLGALY